MASAATPASFAETASATLFVALELSRSTWLGALHSPLTNKVSQPRLDGGDADGLLALITRKRGQAEERLGQPVRVVCCFEAGYDGFWLHRWLCARGIENRVLEAASLLVNRRARRAKTDRLDAAGLLRTRMALERGEAQVCRVVHGPTPAQEDARRRSRERARLIVEQGQHTSRIKGLLMTQGLRDFEPTRRDWQARFEALRTPDGLPLAPCLRAELLRECRRLWLVMEMIAEVEAEQKGRCGRGGRPRRPAGAAARHRARVRHRAGQRGVLPRLPQSGRGGRLPRPCIKLRSAFDVGFSGFDLMGSSPERPSDHVSGPDAALGQAHRHAPDLLDRPADQAVA